MEDPMPARPCWKLPEPDPRPGSYFCTAQYGGRTAFLSGPFNTHSEALADLPRAKGCALDSGDPKAAFAAYGTAHVEGPDMPRVFFPI
jgi:hypothetical protein